MNRGRISMFGVVSRVNSLGISKKSSLISASSNFPTISIGTEISPLQSGSQRN
jgi:hypothetical protein